VLDAAYCYRLAPTALDPSLYLALREIR